MSDQLLETLLDEEQLSPLLRISSGAPRYWLTLGPGPWLRKVAHLLRNAPSDGRTLMNHRLSGGEFQTEVAQ